MNEETNKNIKDLFFSTVTPNLLTIAKDIIHPYNLLNYTLEYRMCRFYITVEGYSAYGKCTVTRELSTL
jgi:hypothetical protein